MLCGGIGDILADAGPAGAEQRHDRRAPDELRRPPSPQALQPIGLDRERQVREAAEVGPAIRDR
jgi:hypothetical protein